MYQEQTEERETSKDAVLQEQLHLSALVAEGV